MHDQKNIKLLLLGFHCEMFDTERNGECVKLTTHHHLAQSVRL